MKAVCIVPVQVYDEGLAGIYQPGQEIEGQNGRLLVERFPEYFQAKREPSPKGKE